MKDPAIVLASGNFRRPNGKGAHGLVRGSDRFRILAVVDDTCAGQDAGELLDGERRNIPMVASIDEALDTATEPPHYAIVGIATHGGRFTPELRALILTAVGRGLSLVNGLHDAASDDPEIAAVAARHRVQLIDLRKSKPKRELHFWTGEIASVKAPRVAVLGTDCALGKRTTTRFLVEALNRAGVRAEMIYTGQTGWMQGARYGLILDCIANDFVSGELEHALVSCDREVGPDVMVIEGQSALRNPSGPCGAELLVSGGARAVVLQHAAGREFFEGYESQGLRIPSLESEIELIGHYGARTLAITLNGHHLGADALAAEQARLEATLGLPVIRPLEEGVDALVPLVKDFAEAERGSA